MSSSPPAFSRRDFIRGLGSAALASRLGFYARPVRATQRKLGIALVGLGRYSTGQLGPALRETKLCYLASVVTGHPEKGERWAADYGLKPQNVYSYETFDRIADNRDVDVVYVVTPPALHPGFVVRAAKAGKHVISEKPMATSVADCDRMIAACKAAKVQLGVGYRLHYDPFHQEMVRIASEFSPITKMTGNFSFVMRQREFRIDKKLGGGGPLMDLGIYPMHAACMATGATPAYVTAHEEPKQNPDLFNEVEETIRFKLEFHNGAVCDVLTSFNGSGNNFRFESEKGWVEFQSQAFSYRGIVAETSRGPMSFPTINQQAAQMDDFADCALTGRKTPVPGELGRRDIQIITAIYEAARTGKRVKVAA